MKKKSKSALHSEPKSPQTSYKNSNTKYISGGGQMGVLIREFRWDKTSLGPIITWPQSLITAVNLILHSPVPMVMLWGEEGIMLYNDGYSVFAGKRHPSLLGSKVLEGWPEVAEFNKNVMKYGLKGKTLSYAGQQLVLYRNNKPEEVWMDLNYSPVIDESGKPAGVLAIVIETTKRVLAEQKQKEAESRLQAESNRLQTLFMQAPAVIAVLRGKDHVFELANPMYMQLVGKNRDIIGKPVGKALPEVKKQGFIKLLDTVYNTGKPFIGSEIYIELHSEKNGKHEGHYLNFVYFPLTDTKGKVEGIFVHAVDVTEQVLIRFKIEESEERFRTLIEKSTDAVQIVSPEGKILYTSESIKNVLGYTAEEMQNKTVLPFLHPDDHAYFMQEFGKLLNGKQQQIQLQYRVKHKDKSWAWLEVTGVNHLDTPNINALVGTFRNITEEKKQQEALKESEARFRVMSDTVPVMIWITEPSGKCTYLNKQWYDYTGQTVADSLGFGWLKAVHPDDENASGKAFIESNKKQMPLYMEYRLRAQDGSYRWHLDSALPKFDKDGKYEGLVGSVVDIHERKMTEVALKENKERQLIMLQASRLGLWYCDLPFDELIWDDKVKEHFWLPKDTRVTIEMFYDYIHPDDREATKNAIQYSLDNHTSYDIEYRTVNRKDGRIKWIQAMGRTFYDKNDKPLRFDGVTIDITDRKALERQKDDFLGIASHELKTPVTSIKAYGQTLEMLFRRKGDIRAADQLHKLDMQVDKLSNLISDLLDVTKIQSGKILFHETDFDFNGLVAEIVEEVQRTAPNHRIQVSLQKTRTISGDRDRIGQVLANLITNAVKYSPQSDKIIVSTKTSTTSVQLQVTDFGVGIPETMQKKVFEQFFRVSGQKQETFPGLGLGLYISKQIIQREGGKIWVTSTEGEGSSFFFSLPLRKSEKKVVSSNQ